MRLLSERSEGPAWLVSAELRLKGREADVAIEIFAST